jgi:hypothetical protein
MFLFICCYYANIVQRLRWNIETISVFLIIMLYKWRFRYINNKCLDCLIGRTQPAPSEQMKRNFTQCADKVGQAYRPNILNTRRRVLLENYNLLGLSWNVLSYGSKESSFTMLTKSHCNRFLPNQSRISALYFSIIHYNINLPAIFSCPTWSPSFTLS